jgi:hypothetical protein
MSREEIIQQVSAVVGESSARFYESYGELPAYWVWDHEHAYAQELEELAKTAPLSAQEVGIFLAKPLEPILRGHMTRVLAGLGRMHAWAEISRKNGETGSYSCQGAPL